MNPRNKDPRLRGKARTKTEAEARYIRKAFALRRRLSNKALAKKFNLSESTVTTYGHGKHKEIGQRRPDNQQQGST